MTEVTPVQGEVVVPAKPRKRGNGELVKTAEAPPPAPAVTGGPSLLAILQAVMTDPSASIERMNSAFDFYQRVETASARKEFEAALANAKAEFDPIIKRHAVGFDNKGGGKTSYKHEDLADIEAAVTPALSKYGLNYRWRAASNPNEPIRVTCVLTHRAGHSEENTLSAGADTSGGKNSIQAIGSTIAYLERYTLKLSLGLAAGREDDGKASGQPPSDFITDAQCSTILDKIAETEANIERFCTYFKVDGVAKLPAKEFERAMGLLSQKGRK
jgi:hypothetical protein